MEIVESDMMLNKNASYAGIREGPWMWCRQWQTEVASEVTVIYMLPHDPCVGFLSVDAVSALAGVHEDGEDVQKQE